MKSLIFAGTLAFSTTLLGGSLRDAVARMAGNPAEIVFCTRPLAECHLMYATFGEYADEWNTSIYPKGGSEILALDVRTGKTRTVFADVTGSFRDVRVSYDGTRILFAWRKSGGVYHLCEIGADGTGFRRITDGPDDDFDACYLPGGGFVFSSGRCRRFIPCNRVRTANLWRCDDDGKNVMPLSSNVLLEDRPAVLPDGQVVYTRWDYVDRATETFRDVWVMNPDGTNPRLLWGGSDEGRAYLKFHAKCDAMPVPGKRQVVCVFSPAFGYRENAGKLHLVDLDKGPDDDAAAHPIGPDVSGDLGWDCGNGGALCMKGFRDPFPFSDDLFLVCRGDSIQVVNRAGDCETIWTGKTMPHDPRPLAARPRETAIAPRTDLSKDTGVFFLADIYESRNMKGVARGTVKKLLIMEDLPKSASRHGWRGDHGGHISLHRVLGEVPVEEDGSAYFEAPALRALMFAALDGDGIAVKRMQNFTQVMPGERLGCVGCHEKRTAASVSDNVLKTAAGRSLAIKRPPSKIQPIPGVPEVFRYVRDIQPVWDRNCLKCHSDGTASGHVVLTGEKTEWNTMSYDMLYAHDQISRATAWLENGNHGSYGFGTGASPLMDKISGKHHGVKVSRAEYDRVRTWIDSSGHFSGTYGTHNYYEAQVGADLSSVGSSINRENAGTSSCYNSFSKPVLAEPMESVAKRKCYSCHGGMLGLGRLRREQRDYLHPIDGKPPEYMARPNYSLSLFNLSDPERSLFLTAAMPVEKGGRGWCTNAQGKAVSAFTGKGDPDYKTVATAIADAIGWQKTLGRSEDPGYRPMPYYVYWMKRFGVLPADFDAASDPIDCFETDEAYWRSLWWCPPVTAEQEGGR